MCSRPLGVGQLSISKIFSHIELKKVLVLGLDGMPHSLVVERLANRPSSIWHSLLAEGRLYRIRSSRPEVSSVAWASYLTGADPGEHGLFGFVDRKLYPFRLYYPNGENLKRPTLLERVDEATGTVVSINVPVTYPPKDVWGLVVGGFLGVRLETNVHPPEKLPWLKRHGYVIDVDPALAHKDRDKFYKELQSALEARRAVALEAAGEYKWDLFQLHIMETDRLFHFFWGDKSVETQFQAMLDRVDEIVAEFAEVAKAQKATFVVLSDHGFTRARRIVFMNSMLKRLGYLRFTGHHEGLETIAPESIAYSLAPGRIFLNVRGREPKGNILPGSDYSRQKMVLRIILSDLRDPQDNTRIFREVLPRERVYQGPHIEHAADLIAFPREGIDLKADFGAGKTIARPERLIGTHTWDDAFFYVSGPDQPQWADDEEDIAAAGRWVAKLLGLEET